MYVCHVDVYISNGNPLRRLMCTQGLEQGRMVLTEDVLVYVYMYTVKLEALPWVKVCNGSLSQYAKWMLQLQCTVEDGYQCTC